ncbi:hypothetical protein [Streptomyces sp. NPDC058486]|uniref:hypothetical protein n=1 Tax=unclassified Streptomyces TaxID=2593676 RepID=UPI00365EBF4F
MTTDLAALRGMSDVERLAALRSLTPAELAELKDRMQAAHAETERLHGVLPRVSLSRTAFFGPGVTGSSGPG